MGFNGANGCRMCGSAEEQTVRYKRCTNVVWHMQRGSWF